jgi:hypothetical protein
MAAGGCSLVIVISVMLAGDGFAWKTPPTVLPVQIG